MKKLEYDKALDKEYLSKPLLDVKYEIGDTFIRVQTENTSFIYQEKKVKLVQEDILKLYSDVVQKCRAGKIKIHYTNKYKKTVVEHWELYVETYKEYCADYKKLLGIVVVMIINCQRLMLLWKKSIHIFGVVKF